MRIGGREMWRNDRTRGRRKRGEFA
jgi:hypothetical protein